MHYKMWHSGSGNPLIRAIPAKQHDISTLQSLNVFLSPSSCCAGGFEV